MIPPINVNPASIISKLPPCALSLYSIASPTPAEAYIALYQLKAYNPIKIPPIKCL